MAAQQSAQERQETGIQTEPDVAADTFSDFRYGQTDLGNSERFIRQHCASLYNTLRKTPGTTLGHLLDSDEVAHPLA